MKAQQSSATLPRHDMLDQLRIDADYSASGCHPANAATEVWDERSMAEKSAKEDPVAGSPNRYNINVLSRAIRILRCFTRTEPNLSLSEIAARSNLPLPTALRILSTLKEHGMVSRDARAELFSLGYELLPMADVVRSGDGLLTAARPIMEKLRDQLNETVILAVSDGDVRTNVFQCESRHEVRRVVSLGAQWPLYVAAGGKAMLAAMPDAEFESYLDRTELRPYTAFTISDGDQLRREIYGIRESGYAESEQEQTVSGAHSFACAICPPQGRAIASLSISLPAVRLTKKLELNIVRGLKESVNTISSALFRIST